MGNQQRLIVCLDGTWNKQDSSTNVLHDYNVIHEGMDPKGVFQKKFYHPGVGTGVLDSVSGGGFGFGLEQNVRDAYNWLIQNYCDGQPDQLPDEIFVFGFSRGAYTARSLVGFIGQCGLLHRAAPITVTQLWQDYCILGRQKEERRSAWEKILWKPKARIRQITELIPDPWSTRGRSPALDLNPKERLLVRWSRRVRITYLGIYDTVGAIGWDALAIPGLTSRMALHNNLRPTTLIQHCRHALALDEHRSSFNHTPFLAFVGNDLHEVDRGGEGSEPSDAAGDARQYWDRARAMWRRKIEQRWFVGAHSNVGGGYEDNHLSERPLGWILEGARQQGLMTESIPGCAAVTQADQLPRDSYAEFAPPLWTKLIRAKRNYRVVDPDPVPQASAKKGKDDAPAAGFSLQTINEKIDDSIVEYWKASHVSLPPNLQEYAQRKHIPIPEARRAAHKWLDEKFEDYLYLVLWATLAAVGLFAVDKTTGLIPPDAKLWVGCLIAFLLPLVDWSESAVTFKCALGSRDPRARAFLDAIYWSRMLGFVLFVFGVAYSIAFLFYLGWRHEFQLAMTIGETYWPVPVCAAGAAILASKLRSWHAWATLVAGPATTAFAGGILIAAGWCVADLFPEIRGTTDPNSPLPGLLSPAVGRSLPGLLLLLQLALIYFWRAMLWTADPMAQANLGSVVPLQRCLTPAKVAACLERWRSQLECRWLNEDPVSGPAAIRMRELLGLTLWRDMLGFIPVYSLVFLFGLWFAAQLPAFEFLNQPGGGLALWWMIPLLAAVTDYVEDLCHLHFRKLHELGKRPSAAVTLLSWSMSRIKGLAVIVALALTCAAVLGGTWMVRHEVADWRAKIAVVISALTVGALVLAVLARIIHFFLAGKTAPESEPPQEVAAQE
jgi:uncharacterized protein (DUF2235 family)